MSGTGQIARLLRDRGGNFGIITALLALPLCGVVGLAIDFSRALDQREHMLAAADAAALGAIAEKSSGIAAARQMMTDGQIAAAIDDARKLFTAQLAARGLADPVEKEFESGALKLDVDVTRNANTVSSNVSFEARVPTTFLSVIGKSYIPISGTAKALYQLGSYIDFFMLLDNTPSMGVGATPADIATMEANTGDKCAFACHETGNPNNYYNLAKKLGVSMRIDTVRKATQELTQTAKSVMRFPEQYRMGVYTFGATAEDAKLTAISAPNANLDTVRKFTDAVDLMTIPKQGYNNDQQTSFDSALTQMNAIIDTPGLGTGPSDRQKVLFFVADGVGDSYKPKGCTKTLTGNRCQEPIDTSFCKPLKDRGISIAVLYTTYLPLPKNSWYNSWIKPFQSEISTKMQACASPGLFFEVSPTQGISDAMQALFMKIINRPRLAS